MTLWTVFRRGRLRVATCFIVFPFVLLPAIYFNLALRDKLPAWFEFSAISSDNVANTVKFYFTVGSLMQPFDFKVTLFVLSPLWLISQYFEILANIDIQTNVVMNQAYQNETQAGFITNLEIFRCLSLVAAISIPNYFV